MSIVAHFSARGFQSTRPARGATVSALLFFVFSLISIHAPREGRDHPK